MAPAIAFAYSVNGVVDFTYNSYQTRIGNTTTSGHTFNEHYEVNIAGFMFDPRFLRLTAGVGYNRTHQSNAADYNTLNYNVNAQFFPGRMFSWDVYATQSTMKVQSNASLSGYDVDTTSYGASLNLNLSRIRPRVGNNNVNNSGNNNNSDNNSNNNQEGRRRWTILSYPDIYLSTRHQESESKNLQNPLHEERDNTSAIILYRINSTMDMRLSGSAEDYKNLNNGSYYNTKTADLFGTVKVSSTGELRFNGSLNERTIKDITGFESTTTRTTTFGIHLDFREQNRIAQNYGYNYTDSRIGGAEYLQQSASGYIRYVLLPELSLYGGLNYAESEYTRKATATAPYDSSSMTSGGFMAGASYRKSYSPGFLEPFVFNTNYDFGAGYTNMSTLTGGDLGGGNYYTNAVGLGLVSSGWKYETMNFDFNYNNRRDNSPMNNDSMAQAYRFALATSRVPRTSISVSLGYRVQHTSASSVAGVFSPSAQGLDQSARTLDYAASIDHTLNQNVTLSAGGTQSRATSNVGYTLSTLTTYYDTQVLTLYAQGQFNYSFTRDLHFNASLREEQRQADYAADISSHIASMGINHRIRALILSADWRWREDVTDHMPRIFQQSLMMKVSRPF